MNEVLATVDAIARQRSFAREDEDEEEEGEGGRAVIEMADEEDGEKTEVMKQAAAYLASARIDKRVGHLVVKIKGVAEGNVCRIVCVIKVLLRCPLARCSVLTLRLVPLGHHDRVLFRRHPNVHCAARP
eukprot:3877485-Rhodomonas_salina.5